MKLKRTPGLLDMFGGTLEIETIEFAPETARKLYESGPTKLVFHADRLQDVIFRIGGEEFNIDFNALVRDYGKAVDDERA